jgi:hypothetical protein
MVSHHTTLECGGRVVTTSDSEVSSNWMGGVLSVLGQNFPIHNSAYEPSVASKHAVNRDLGGKCDSCITHAFIHGKPSLAAWIEVSTAFTDGNSSTSRGVPNDHH